MTVFKIISKKIALIVILFSSIVSLAVIFYFNNSEPKNILVTPTPSVVSNIPVTDNQGSGLPVGFKIPGLNIDVVLKYVGITSDGAMDMPKSTDDVGWYELGGRPGNIGSAVVAGHYGIKNGKASVFDNLYKLVKGDKIYVEDDRGTINTFIVRESRNYDPKADTTEIFNSNDGKSHLNLITCEGTWNKDLKSYSGRLVVFTDKE